MKEFEAPVFQNRVSHGDCLQAPANDPSYARFLWWLSFLRSEFNFVTARSYICATQHAAAHRAMRPTQAPESARPDSANHPSIRVSSARFGKHLSIRVSPARYGKPSVHPSQPGPILQTIRPSESARPDSANHPSIRVSPAPCAPTQRIYTHVT